MSPSTPAAPAEAIAVLKKFLDAGLKRDTQTMRACLSRATLESGGFNENGPQDVRFELGQAVAEGDLWIVPVNAFPIDQPPGADVTPQMSLPAVLVQEDGAWKLDLAASMDRMLGGSMQAAMQQMGDAMGQAMKGIGTALSEAFGGSAPEAGPVKWLEADTTYAPEELFPLPEMVPLPKLESALASICRHPVRTGVAVKDLLKQVGSDDSKTLMDWLDDALFAGWISMLALLANKHPFIRRLQGFRVEAAKSDEQRLLILDGSDLVYRMCIDRTSGYYSDDFINELLPGILAGLPEVEDPILAGHRSIHTDEEPADLELFKQHALPRFMKRICQLLGKEITLEANWEESSRPEEDTRQFLRWSLNRIYGALALACQDARRKADLAAEFKGIKINVVFNIADRAAAYVDGILELGLDFIQGETGCFYEKDLVRVLEGEVIKYVDPNETADTPEEDEEDDASDDDLEEDDDNDADEEAEAEEDDDEVEDDEDEEEEDLDEEAKARRLNDENFRTAAAGLKENESIWAMQLAYVFGHPTAVELDFDSLGGDYALVQPFIHQGLTAVLEAMPGAVMEKILAPDLVQECQKVVIRGTREGPCQAAYAGRALQVSVPLQIADIRPPTSAVTAALRAMAGGDLEKRRAEAANEVTVDMTAKPSKKSEAGGGEANDPYARATAFTQELESAMRENNLWPGDKPAGDIEVRGAFGSENMAFTQWLAWILIPRVHDIVETRGSFPDSSQVAAYAVREFDGVHEAGPVIDLLIAFDDMINHQR